MFIPSFPSPLVTMLLALILAGSAAAHHVISYPGTRGDNLITNQTFPFGMQWMYPCGALSPTTNRSYWPTTGGAFAAQPGWFRGHSSSLWYINLGLGASPFNYSLPMKAVFRIRGPPGDNPFPGTFCLPQLPLPAGYVPRPGDLASIQAVQVHAHGAPAYSCSDIVFTDDLSQVPKVDESNCFNSSDITVEAVQVLSDREIARIAAGQSSSPGQPSTGSNASATTTGPGTVPSSGSGSRLVARLSSLLGFLAML